MTTHISARSPICKCPRCKWKRRWRYVRARGYHADARDPVARNLLVERDREKYRWGGIWWRTQEWETVNWQCWSERRTWYEIPKVQAAIRELREGKADGTHSTSQNRTYR